MPFTPAHIAAVLPMTARPRRWVVPAAWVLGSMVPDLVWFLMGTGAYDFAHSLLGVITLDVIVGAVLVAVWRFVVVAPARDVAPAALGERMPDRIGLRPSEWPAVALGVAAGALTHVVWDAFTHPGRWGTTHIAVLRDDVGGLAGYRWAQYVSGVIGLAIVAVFVLSRYRTHPALPVADRRVSPRSRAAMVFAVVAIPLVVAAIAGVLTLPEGLRAALVFAASRFAVALLVTVIVVSAVWWRLPRRVNP